MIEKAESRARQHYIREVILALRSLGGQATPKQVYALLRKEGRIRAADRHRLAAEPGWFEREVRFARQELYLAGLIASPSRGTWTLLEKGQIAGLSDADINDMMKGREATFQPHSPSDGISVTEFNESNPSFVTTGPRPIDWAAEVTRSVGGPAWTYVFQFAETTLWKIGHTNDPKTRLLDVNRHIPSELLTGEWRISLTQIWSSSVAAYEMEQQLLTLLNSSRTVGERVMCTRAVLLAAWQQATVQAPVVVTRWSPAL